MGITMKFKIWSKEENRFLEDSNSLHVMETYFLDLYGNAYVAYEAIGRNETQLEALDKKDYEILHSTGLEDKNGVEIFEGDILEIEYFVGDFAWDFMDEEERQKNIEMQGEKYEVEVVRHMIHGNNLELSGNCKRGDLFFPLSYIPSGIKLRSKYDS